MRQATSVATAPKRPAPGTATSAGAPLISHTNAPSVGRRSPAVAQATAVLERAPTVTLSPPAAPAIERRDRIPPHHPNNPARRRSARQQLPHSLSLIEAADSTAPRYRPRSSIRTRRRTEPEQRHAGPDTLRATFTEPGLQAEQEVLCCRAIQEADVLRAQASASRSSGGGARASFAYQQAVQRAAQAQQQLVQGNKGYILLQARRMLASTGAGRSRGGQPSSALLLDDLFTAGVLGLTHAARRFDLSGGGTGSSSRAGRASAAGGSRARFLTFAHHHIRKAMFEALRAADLDVYVPRHITDIKARVSAALSDLQQQQQQQSRASSSSSSQATSASPLALLPMEGAASAALQSPQMLRALAARTGLRESHVADALSLLSTRRTALGVGGEEAEDEQGGAGGGRGDAEAALAALWRVEPADAGAAGARGRALAVADVHDLSAVDETRGDKIKEALSQVLTKRELQVVWLMMGLDRSAAAGAGDAVETLDKSKLGALLGVSRQAVSQVIDRALGKLRAACAADARLMRELQELCGQEEDA